MADENNVVKQVVWSEVFSFPHIFKSFKMAIQPGKLVLAVLALALIFGGGYALDWIWCAAGQTVPVAPRGQDTAILSHAGMDSDNYSESEFVAGFFDTRLERAADLLVAVKNDERSLSWWVAKGGVFATPAFRERLDEYNKDVPGDDPQNTTEVLAAAKKEGDDYDDLIGQAEEALDQEFAKVEEILYDGKDELPDVLEDELDKQIADLSKQDEFTEEQAEEMREGFERNIAAIDRAFTDRQVWFNQQVRTIRGDGVFESFLAYETNCLNNAMMALWNLNIRGGLCNYQALVEGRGTAPVTADLATGLPAPSAVRQANEQNGFLYYVLMAVEGFRWMSLQHWLFAIIFLVWTLAIVACFGGAISRMTALHFAREEKISIGQGLRFSRGKFLSFFSAPLVPIAVIVLTGLLISLGGFLFSLVPWIGPILMGLLFGLALLLGIGIAFMAIGLAAGWPLMYPTIAVEGSDSFDAISRSFSYVFARPFRAAFYGVVAAVYGTITYLFVRLFAYLTLLAVHAFVKLGFWDLYFDYGESLSPNADMIDVLWHRPSFWDLQTVNWAALSGVGWVAAILVGVWVAAVVGAVLGYVWTYFTAASTSIYFVLRRRVDATDLDDVYIEEEQEPLAPAEESVVEGDVEGDGADKADEEAEEEKDEGQSEPSEESAEKDQPEDEADGAADESDKDEASDEDKTSK